MSRRYVLLDRDGTVIVDKHYLSDPEQVEFLPGVVEGLRRMADLGWGLVLLTNQSGVGRGYFDVKSVDLVHERLSEMLRGAGLRFDGIYHCPHAPEEECACRKPASGMAEQAAADLGFELGDCVVVGDKEADVRLGKNIGAFSILVRTGKGAAHEERCRGVADQVVDGLEQAADIIGVLTGDGK